MGQGDSLRDRVEDADSGTGVDDDKLLELAEWTYKNVEEVFSGFNLIADTVAKGARVRGDTQAEAWGEDVDVQEKVRMIVVNALVYGRAVMEAGEDFLKIRSPRNITLEQDADGDLVGVTQEIDGDPTELDPDDVWVFTLHRLFSDDIQGVSRCNPCCRPSTTSWARARSTAPSRTATGRRSGWSRCPRTRPRRTARRCRPSSRRCLPTWTWCSRPAPSSRCSATARTRSAWTS